MPLTLSRTELVRTANLIDGTWRDALDGRRFDVVDPATLDIVAHAPDSGAADARAATDAAARALPAWRATPPANGRRSCAHGMPRSLRIPTISRN
ncbi:Aldehyde dehydrogenase family [Burkholderia cepacia]|nr:Aldehyde dehydrogenase family [Burkholderia cepacia]